MILLLTADSLLLNEEASLLRTWSKELLHKFLIFQITALVYIIQTKEFGQLICWDVNAS
jgi:hypothetical protein